MMEAAHIRPLKLDNTQINAQNMIDKQLLTIQVVDMFLKDRDLYNSIAKLLEKQVLPLIFQKDQLKVAQIQARAKSPASIAGKVLKKYINLGDPNKIFAKFTDFVGARIIFLRREQVESADMIIRKNFNVDDRNTLNAANRLNEREFGYLSRHYIIKVDQNWIKRIKNDLNLSTECCINIEPEKSVFVELQVRTWLQHVWADLSHDSIYKGDYVIPRKLQRSWNALAAILENADEDISACLEQLEQYQKNSPYYIEDERERKIETLETIAISQLMEKACNKNTNESSSLIGTLRELNRLYSLDETPRNLIDELGKICNETNLPQKDLIIQYLKDLKDDESISQNATDNDPTNPKMLLKYFEQIILNQENQNWLKELFSLPILLKAAIVHCENMIKTSEELPWAFAGKAFFQLLLMELQPEEHIDEYDVYDTILRLFDICNERSVANLGNMRRVASKDSKEAREILTRIITQKQNQLFAKLSKQREDCAAPVIECIIKLLELGNYAFAQDQSSSPDIPAVIIAGGCDSVEDSEMEDFQAFFTASLKGKNKINFYTGAGNSGICTLNYGKEQEDAVKRFGICGNDKAEFSRYHNNSIFEALMEWEKIKEDRYRFDDVALVGFCLGKISTLECKIALAFGARVTIIGHKNFTLNSQTFDEIPYWSSHPSLVRLPLIKGSKPMNRSFSSESEKQTKQYKDNGFPEPMMLRVFMLFKPFHANDYQNPSEETNDLTKLIHRIKQLKMLKNPKDFSGIEVQKRLSEQHRLLFFEILYKDVHGENVPSYKVKVPDSVPPSDKEQLKEWLLKISFKEINDDYQFGEREHARWYIERWLQGTRYGDNKIDCNVPASQKKNPCMVAWFDLDDDTITKDTDFLNRYIIAKALQGNSDFKNAIEDSFKNQGNTES